MSEPCYVETWEHEELSARVAALEMLHAGGLDLIRERDYLRQVLQDVLREYEYGTGKIGKERADVIAEAVRGEGSKARAPTKRAKRSP